MNIRNSIANMDLIDYLPMVPDEYVDEIILDPPYFKVVNEKWDNEWSSLEDYLAWFNTVIEQVYRVSKYSCSVWIFGFPYQLSYIIPIMEKNGFRYKQTITLDKGLRSVAGRTSSKLKMFPTATEQILYFYKDAHDEIRNFLIGKKKASQLKSVDINRHLGKAINGGGTWSCIAGPKKKDIQYPTRADWDKLQEILGTFEIDYDDYIYKFNQEQGITDVWRDINFYDRQFGPRIHPTQKPYDLIQRLVKCSTDKGDVVMDLFMGSGMTAKVCMDLERVFIGCEKDKVYHSKSLDFLNLTQPNDLFFDTSKK